MESFMKYIIMKLSPKDSDLLIMKVWFLHPVETFITHIKNSVFSTTQLSTPDDDILDQASADSLTTVQNETDFPCD